MAAKEATKGEDRLTFLWGPKAAGLSWIMVPVAFIGVMKRLGLKYPDQMLLLILLSHWRDGRDDPYPGEDRIAGMMGADQAYVHRRLKALAARGVIRITPGRPGRGHSSSYDLRPLRELLSGVEVPDVPRVPAGRDSVTPRFNSGVGSNIRERKAQKRSEDEGQAVRDWLVAHWPNAENDLNALANECYRTIRPAKMNSLDVWYEAVVLWGSKSDVTSSQRSAVNALGKMPDTRVQPDQAQVGVADASSAAEVNSELTSQEHAAAFGTFIDYPEPGSAAPDDSLTCDVEPEDEELNIDTPDPRDPELRAAFGYEEVAQDEEHLHGSYDANRYWDDNKHDSDEEDEPEP